MRIEEERNHSRSQKSQRERERRERREEREAAYLMERGSERASEIGAVGENRREKAIGLMSK